MSERDLYYPLGLVREVGIVLRSLLHNGPKREGRPDIQYDRVSIALEGEVPLEPDRSSWGMYQYCQVWIAMEGSTQGIGDRRSWGRDVALTSGIRA